MQQYAICEISGKQYKLLPNRQVKVDFMDPETNSKPEIKLLMLANEDKVSIGKPYLADKLNIKVLGSEKNKKIRVAKFHAKANYRRVVGYRGRSSIVVWEV